MRCGAQTRIGGTSPVGDPIVAGIAVCELDDGHAGSHMATWNADPKPGRFIWPLEPFIGPLEIVAHAFVGLLEKETGQGVDDWPRAKMESVASALEAMHRLLAAERLRKSWERHHRTEKPKIPGGTK